MGLKTVGAADYRVAEFVREDRYEHDRNPEKDQADVAGPEPQEDREDEKRRVNLDGETSEPEAHNPRLLRQTLSRERGYSDRLR